MQGPHHPVRGIGDRQRADPPLFHQTTRLCRKGLLAEFDKFRRDADSSGLMDGLDTFNRQAFEVVTSSRLVEALMQLRSADPRISMGAAARSR